MDYKRLFYYFLFPLISLSYVLVPLTNDGRIYIAVEYIADTFYQFPYGFDLAWEIKPMANRLMAWILYKLATLVVPFTETVAFGIAVKFFALCFVVAGAWVFARSIGGRWAFPVTFVAFACVGNFVILQAEYWAVLVSLVALALLLRDNENLHAVAGVLFVVVALFKGVTGLLCVPVICAALLMKRRLYWMDIFGGFVCGASVFVWLNLTIWPNMLPDMLMSAQIARVGQYPIWTYLISEVVYMYTAFLYIPLAAVGVIAGLFMIIRLVQRDIRDAALYAAMWTVSFAIVFSQGEFFIYHYFILTVPALVTILKWEELYGKA